MLKTIVFILLLMPISLIAQTDLELITKKANQFLEDEDFEQARYHWQLAKNLDSLNEAFYEHRIFLTDSLTLNKKGLVRKLSLGDSAMYAGNNGLALRYFADNWGIARSYSDYRIQHILNTDPSSKSKWLAILSKLNPSSPSFDTTEIDTNYHIEIPDSKPSFDLKDSIHYKKLLDSLIKSKNFFVANYVIREHIYDYGQRELFDSDLKRIHLMQQDKILAHARSAALNIERIEKIENTKKPDIEMIKGILDSIDLEKIEDSQIKSKVIQKREVYFK